MKRDYLSLATGYALQVVAGVIPACQYVAQACQRFLGDLERAEGEDFPFRMDGRKATAVCQFVELLPHIKGPKAGERICLEPWQVFILVNVFGWVRRDTGKRRFRKVYIEVPRGNAKSTLSAGIGLYCLVADGEAGAEVYSAATTREQARIVFDVAQQMALKSPGYRNRFKVKVPAHAIVQPDTVSIFKPLASESDTLDGLNIHLAIVDELHAHPDRGVYDVLETGTAKRDQSLFWIISTAGCDRAGICYEVRGYLLKILGGTVLDDSTFGIVYTIDEGDKKRDPPIPGDDWRDPATWRKANPNWGVSVMPEVVEQLALKAIATPSAQNNFLTKHLDAWVNADVAWMDMAKWRACADVDLTIEDFKGARCFGAVDLASKVDFAVALKLFFRDIGVDGQPGKTERHYYCFPTFYLPRAAIEASNNSQYAGWARAGHIQVTPGNIIDFDEIELELKAWPSLYDVAGVAYDPFQATQMSTHMVADGFPMIEVRATVQNFSDPMKEFDAVVRAGRFHHDGNPVMEWMVSNVVCHYDKKDNVFPNKEKPEKKIDGPVAAIMALGRAMIDPGPAASFEPFVV